MNISFNLNVDDWVAFQQYYQAKRAPFYKAVYPLIVGLISGLVVINIIYYFYFKVVSAITWISFILVAVFIYLLYLRKRSLDRVKQAGLEVQKKHPEAFGVMKMDFEANGINIQSQQTSKFIPREEMSQFEENKHYFFLYSKKGVVYIVPKRDIDNTSSFRELLIDYLPQE